MLIIERVYIHMYFMIQFNEKLSNIHSFPGRFASRKNGASNIKDCKKYLY